MADGPGPARPPRAAPAGARQAALSRYSRRVRWMKVALPVVAVALVGAIFLAGRSLTPPEGLLSPEEIAALAAGMRLEAPRFVGQTDAGEPFILRAATAEPEGAMPDRIRLAAPEGEVTLSDGRRLSGRSDRGLMLRAEERVTLEGRVEIETSDGYRFETERLVLDIAANAAASPVPVAGSGPSGTIAAGSMRVVGGERGRGEARIFFEDRVRVVFNPLAGEP